MTNQDARFLLGSCRPGAGDAADPEFAEAFALMEHDAELKTWWDERRRGDAAITAALRSITMPADLRSRILTGGRVSRPDPWFAPQRLWAMAAMLMLFSGLSVWYSLRSGTITVRWDDTAIAALDQLVSGKENFDAKSPNVEDLQRWLKTNGSPTSAALPASVEHLASLGCKTVMFEGHPISIICFHGPGGELVHLAMMERDALANPPPEGTPVYAGRDGWCTACWSQGSMAMMLLTQAPESQLKLLLSATILL